MRLRNYQIKLNKLVDDAFTAGARIVMMVLGCGGGKTACFCYRLLHHNGYCLAIAHRQELVRQMSMTLAKYGVRHRIVAPDNVIKRIIRLQIKVYGCDFYDPSSRCAVAGVDTLIARADTLGPWLTQQTFWVLDEGHHASGVKGVDFTTGNKWCRIAALMPNARGLLVTATPKRADGQGLGLNEGGIVDVMVEGPGERELINAGHLAEYRVICPPSDLDVHDIPIGKDGDVNQKKLGLRTRNSTVMGDVVTHYQKYCPGKLAGLFAPDIETATTMVANFNAAGVPCELVTANTPDDIRFELLQRFERRQILVIANIDILGEGFDCPGMEVVIMARYTESYPLFHQQFLRPCRKNPDDPSKVALIIDHVGNFHRHGPPDRKHNWTLERQDSKTRGKSEDVIPYRTCLNPNADGRGNPCFTPYERFYKACPVCGYPIPEPASRASVEFVDGDLGEVDPATLAAMRGEVAAVDRTPLEVLHMMQRAGHAYPIAKGASNRHAEKQEAQAALREAASLWMGYQQAWGRSVSEAQRRWYFKFNCDVLSAQSLGRAEAEAMTIRICDSICELDAELREGRV
jgi:superfamily II DNA or RNA helicase